MSNRFKVTLPDNYNDILIENELKFKYGDYSIDTIRNILYLYSRAMEYYDSVNNSQAYKYYLEKNNQMLTDEKVLSKLDKISFDVSEKKFFDERKVENKGEVQYSKEGSEEYNINNDNLRRESVNALNRKIQIQKLKEEAEEIVKVAVLNLTERFDSYGRSWLNQLNQQNSLLQDKLDMLSLEPVNVSSKRARSPTIKITQGHGRLSALDISIAEMISNDESQESIIKKLIDEESNNVMSKKGKELQEAEERLTSELEKEIEEIRNTYKDDIVNFEEMGEEYKSVVEGLKEDMEAEIENLKDQYEERKRMERDKIERKYK